jgi:hypothetical protein
MSEFLTTFLLWQTLPIKLKLELYIPTLFFGGAQLCCAFFGKPCEFGAEKPIS